MQNERAREQSITAERVESSLRQAGEKNKVVLL
jgi:hypothetical protein